MVAAADADAEPRTTRQLEAMLPTILGAASALLFMMLSPESFYWLDSAELSAAGVGLGSSHPTGFPLYMMLVKAASLLPIGELAFRVNLLSAICAGAAVTLSARLVITVGKGGARSLVGACLTGASLSTGLLFARHACVAEVYVPTAAVLAGTFLALEAAARGTRGAVGGARAGLLLAVMCGLGLGLHSSFRFLVVVPVVVILWRRLRRGARWPLYAPLLALGIGVAMQLYLPVRSATGRVVALDWGHPDTLAATWDHLSGARIRDAFADEIASGTLEIVSVNIRSLASAIFEGLGPVVILLGLVGIVWLCWRRRTRLLGIALALAACLDVVYGFWINPMGLVDGQNGTPLAVVAAIAAGIGAVRFLERTGRATPYVGAVLTLVAVAMPFASTWSALASASRAPTPRTISDAALGQLPSRGIALTQSDSLSAGLLFLTSIEGARPDVAVLVRQHLRDTERVEGVLGLSRQAQVFIDNPSAPNAAFAAIMGTGRPLFWEIGSDGFPRGLRVRAGVPLATLGHKSEPPPAGDIEKGVAELRRLWADGTGDPLSRRVLATHLTQLGRLAFVRAQIDRAGELFDAALAVRPAHTVALINRGVVHSRRGELDAALALTRRALDVEPNRVAALINACRYARELGDLDAARRYIRRAVSIEPKNERARALSDQLER